MTNMAGSPSPGASSEPAPTRAGNWVLLVFGVLLSVIGLGLLAGLARGWSQGPGGADLPEGIDQEALIGVGAGIVVAAIVCLLIGIVLLLLGAAGIGRDIDVAPGAAPPHGEQPGLPVYPTRLVGYFDPRTSRALWLIKWLLLIPHLIVLMLLWFAVVVTTIAAGLVILFTGRYPRAWFFFCVGVLRWSWRVGFYGYSVLGTDRYPPFTPARTAYPADFDVAYPSRLSHGLVLVKSWLLAIPHLLIVGIFTNPAGGWRAGSDAAGATYSGWSISLLGLLVLIAAVILLFTGRYLEGLFAFIMGLNRWVYRVGAYVLLMRDEYPPFRLDPGPDEPSPPTLQPDPRRPQ